MTDSQIEIMPLPRSRFPDCERLAREVFGFADREIVPAWEMYTVSRAGGLTLGAFWSEELVGYSHAFPAFDGRVPFLYSCGLAVHPRFRSQGLGYRLKIAQRRHALDLGYDLIRWTVDPLASGPLHLYLNKLGGEIVDYVADYYGEIRPEKPSDEAVIEWRILDHDDPAAPVRRQPTATVEIPWDLDRVRDGNIRTADKWRLEMREAACSLLRQGCRGVRLVRDLKSQRSFVAFAEGASSDAQDRR